MALFNGKINYKWYKLPFCNSYVKLPKGNMILHPRTAFAPEGLKPPISHILTVCIFYVWAMACWYSNCDTPQRNYSLQLHWYNIGVSSHGLLSHSHKKHLGWVCCCHDSWLNPITMTGFLTRTARGTSLGRQGRCWTISPWISPMFPAGTVDVFTCFHHFEQPKLRPVNWGRNMTTHIQSSMVTLW